MAKFVYTKNIKETLRKAYRGIFNDIIYKVLFLIYVCVYLPVWSASLTLNFDSAGGTIRDSAGVGTGFTARLAGSGANIAVNDPNILLQQNNGILRLRACRGVDFNGQVGMANASVIGVNLSDLGFTGENDFFVKARFINITNRHGYPDQLCVIVGTSTSNLIRAGFINFDQYHLNSDANEAFAVNTINGVDVSPRFYGSVVGSTMTVEIRRISGKWFVKVDGLDRLPNSNADGSGMPAPPVFLNSETNLFVGVAAMDVGDYSPWVADLDTFIVGVSEINPPSVVAYWRFEKGPAFANVPHSGGDGVFDGTTEDVSGNGNHLSTWTQGGYAGFAYRTDVPFSRIPQTGDSNRFSIKNTGAYPAMFTRASVSKPMGINADTITPLEFTVEAFYKPEANGGYRTVVGRDARYVSSSNGDLAAFYLQVRPDDSAGVVFTDVSGYTHSAFSPPGWIYGFTFSTDPEGTNAFAKWYHLAAVSDGDTLKMYVDHQLVAWTDLTTSGSPNRALATGTSSASGYTAGAWSVGRGLYAGNHTDRAYGFIDEVRICNSALIPSQFLDVRRASLLLSPQSKTTLRLTANAGEPSAVFNILFSENLFLPLSRWSMLATLTFDTNGSYSAVIPMPANVKTRFYSISTRLSTPPAGALTYRLAPGNESWPADIRERIIYAMDGAVALYNRYGYFPKALTANYNPGVPTAQGNYSGWIDFGGMIGFRVALHEISHTLGVGTAPGFCNFVSGGVWTGSNAVWLVRQFDGPNANLYSDCTHIWPYGLNYDNEGGTENFRRHVLIVDAIRRDLGIR